ncbi:unnamed protein product [marine sediment metagenome]|uniref:SIR2-like domain-containing protein n=1 Tax=marine sediment metagenome TaxID=412755 RepID=X0VPA1_9ZZZZ
MGCKECYVVGYSFRDEDILGLFQDAMMMNRQLYLILIDPMAETIAQEKFSEYGERVYRISEAFTEEATRKILKL